jgi:hypothetical protein
MAEAMNGDRTARRNDPPLKLIRAATGSPRAFAAKLSRLARAIAAYANGPALDARLERLRALGYVPSAPSRIQLVVGSVDMLRFWIVPAADDYYRQQGIDFRFHQLLRFLDDPASVVDPTGFLSERDVIIGHVLQVVHANPHYDLQLLESHDRGVDELEAQTRSMLAGTHPRAASIGAIVEEPGYHARLLDYILAYRADPESQAPRRSNDGDGSAFAAVERTFGSLDAAMRYFCRLPTSPVGAALHLLRVDAFPEHLGEPA